MSEQSTELLKGTLDLLVLRTLDLRALHGSAIADRVAQITKGAFQVKAGSLFPALYRLEQEDWIRGEWTETVEGRRVRTYSLTRQGRQQLVAEKANWRRIVRAMNRVIENA